MKFSDLELSPALLRAVEAEGYVTPTPIQQQAIPPCAAGRDLFGIAQTGTGKTAAFALPTLHRLTLNPLEGHRGARPIRVLVLAPTRELAAQSGERFTAYARELKPAIKAGVIFGGVGKQAQIDLLRAGIDVLVATPGRLLDLMGEGYVKLNQVSILVLDEADRMLDMGFIHDVRKVIAAVPKQRQTLLFSATMPNEIERLANDILVDPMKVEVTPVSSTVERIEQSLFFVEKPEKRHLLVKLLRRPEYTRTLVFTRTKHGANRVVEWLEKAGIGAAAIHGNKSQNARERALELFVKGTNPVLVATDIAARGLDIDEVSHVIQYDLPNEPETYVHRIGRTARAGADGTAVAFCEMEERPYLVDIERLTRQHVPRAVDGEFDSPHRPPMPTDLDRKGGQRAPATGPRPAAPPPRAQAPRAPAPAPRARAPAAPRAPAPVTPRSPSPAAPRASSPPPRRAADSLGGFTPGEGSERSASAEPARSQGGDAQGGSDAARRRRRRGGRGRGRGNGGGGAPQGG